jgi:sulfur carrier protein ThiS
MRIFLGGHLSYYHPEKARWLEIDLQEPVPLVDIIEKANIPLGEISLVVLNGAISELQKTIVSEGDEVKLFSPVGGG